jgi:hypothetical protein
MATIEHSLQLLELIEGVKGVIYAWDYDRDSLSAMIEVLREAAEEGQEGE